MKKLFILILNLLLMCGCGIHAESIGITLGTTSFARETADRGVEFKKSVTGRGGQQTLTEEYLRKKLLQ